MKASPYARLANWLLRHFAPGPYAESVAGDLLEELNAGRSLAWYWRQVLAATALGVFWRSRPLLLPLLFSASWSTLFPAWQRFVWENPKILSLFHRWSALNWPYSASSQLGSGVLPAATFVWLGSFLYLLLRAQPAQKHLGFRLARSLSLSLNVLLVTSIVLVSWPGRPEFHTHPLFTSPGSPSASAAAFSIPLALGLFSAILSVLPPRLHPRASV